jgi:hypothetical protein
LLNSITFWINWIKKAPMYLKDSYLVVKIAGGGRFGHTQDALRLQKLQTDERGRELGLEPIF